MYCFEVSEPETFTPASAAWFAISPLFRDHNTRPNVLLPLVCYHERIRRTSYGNVAVGPNRALRLGCTGMQSERLGANADIQLQELSFRQEVAAPELRYRRLLHPARARHECCRAQGI
jgi:hypothetical protein